MRRRYIAFAFVGVLIVASCRRNTKSLPFSVIPQPSEVSLNRGGV